MSTDRVIYWLERIAVVLALIALIVFGVRPILAYAADGTYSFSDFAIPNPNRGDTARTLLVIDASEHVGQTCTINVDTVNGESVHPENFVTVEGVIPTIVVSGTEDGAFGEHQNTETVTIGQAGTITVVNHFSLATSVEGTIQITCDTTTTTLATSTTTPPSTTSTTDMSTTSSSTVTTTPSTSTSSTLVPPAPTSTVPTESTTTTGVVSTRPTFPINPPPDIVPVTTVPDGGTLPSTGPEVDNGILALTATALLMLGAAGVIATKEDS